MESLIIPFIKGIIRCYRKKFLLAILRFPFVERELQRIQKGLIMPRIFNTTALKERRRELRNNQTPAEKMLWQKIRKKQLSGIQFYRQYGIGAYIADFYAPVLRLCIEVDGIQHHTK